MSSRKKIFGKRLMVAEGVRVPVSRHFYYSPFGVCTRYEIAAKSGKYVCSGTPGTGFFARSTDSQSYRKFVAEERKKTEQSVWTLLFRREPDFDKESKLVDEALRRSSDDNVRRILSSYQNVIGLAKEEELLQRVVRSLKERLGGRNNQMMLSIISHYKSAIATLDHDVQAAQINACGELDEEQLTAWRRVMDTFLELAASRRLWSVYDENGSQAYQQVFFDAGVFDYIRSPYDTPVLRDYAGNHFYLYPKGLVAVRSSVDFDVFVWKRVGVRFGVVDLNTLAVRPRFSTHYTSRKHRIHNDAISTLYGASRAQVVGELVFEFGGRSLRFFVNHTGPADDFAKALGEFMKTIGKKQ